MNKFRFVETMGGACAAGFLLLAGCSGSTTSGRAEPGVATRPGSAQSVLMEVRAAGAIGNEIDVQPLRDPQVEDLRAAATLAESRNDFAGAQRSITQALQITPDDPDLLQWRAELALVVHDWAEAERSATRSFEKGPKLGGLCRRNWTTLRMVAESRKDSALAAQAQQHVAGCAVAPPLRM